MYGMLSQIYLLGAFVVFIVLVISELGYKEISSAYKEHGIKAILRGLIAIFFSWFAVIWALLRLKNKDWGR